MPVFKSQLINLYISEPAIDNPEGRAGIKKGIRLLVVEDSVEPMIELISFILIEGPPCQFD